ncbi:transposable element Tcb2 transposase [Trichonephila clavipes]|nr:transposable element Tcb2 transposase [Trichonephila clavipes]
MPLRRFRRQYAQLSQFERGRIIGMMEAGWSARRVARQLRRSDCAVRRFGDQWIQEMSFARRPDSGRPQQSSRRADRHIVRNARALPTASSRLAEGHLESWRPLCVLSLTPTHRCLRLEWCRAPGNWLAAEWNQVIFSDDSRFNLISDDNRVLGWRPHGKCLNPSFALQRHTTSTASVMVWGDIIYNTRYPVVP